MVKLQAILTSIGKFVAYAISAILLSATLDVVVIAFFPRLPNITGNLQLGGFHQPDFHLFLSCLACAILAYVFGYWRIGSGIIAKISVIPIFIVVPVTSLVVVFFASCYLGLGCL